MSIIPSKSLLLTFLFALTSLALLYRCVPHESSAETSSPYRNATEDATYVGMDKCRKCHESVYQTFKETGMGKSFGLATPQKSAALFDAAHAHVYDKDNDLHYRPFFRNDSLFVQEYRTLGTDTTFSRTEHIKYIVGSGQHTNSHIIEKNGYLYQAPITFYTQKKIWDMAPGFDGGSNSRFDRKIQLECMSCHNSMPLLQDGSLNKFLKVGHGIDCERCHGPGSIHVQEKESGKIIDTSKGPDYSIVNPKRLTSNQQNNICMRCHLQGITVPKEEHSFYDFKPSLILSDYMTTFLPQYQGGQDKLIMASHVERMMMSSCYLQSGELSCISCHNPHISVKNTPQTQYNQACQSCHQNPQHSSVDISTEKGQDCVSCHMPKTGSIDIPHVAVTDHYIRIPNTENDPAQFRGLYSYNNANPSNKTISRGYLELYERYVHNNGLLDSAKKYMPSDDQIDNIRLAYLQENFSYLYNKAKDNNPKKIDDAWTAYRLGEACFNQKDAQRAAEYFLKATTLKPFVTEFKLKYAISLLLTDHEDKARQLLEELGKEDPNNYLSFYNLAIYYQKNGNLQESQKYLQKAKALNPDVL